MELSHIIPHIEALIFASDKPLTNLDLVELLNSAMGFIEDRATLDQVESAVDGIHEKYNSEFYAFELKQSGGGWQFLTKKEYHKTVAQLNGDKFLKRLSNAALETLAIIAYKQPVTKSEIESIRGVNCDYAVQKLLEKDLVVIAGRNEEAVGKPLIYTTSKSFMDYFGINSTDDLPKINEVLMEELVQATIVNGEPQKEADLAEGEDSPGTIPAVTQTGEIVGNNHTGLDEKATVLFNEMNEGEKPVELIVVAEQEQIADWVKEISTDANLEAESDEADEAIIEDNEPGIANEMEENEANQISDWIKEISTDGNPEAEADETEEAIIAINEPGIGEEIEGIEANQISDWVKELSTDGNSEAELDEAVEAISEDNEAGPGEEHAGNKAGQVSDWAKEISTEANLEAELDEAGKAVSADGVTGIEEKIAEVNRNVADKQAKDKDEKAES